jgi:hypothetical protein
MIDHSPVEHLFTKAQRKVLDRALAHVERVHAIRPTAMMFAWCNTLTARQIEYCNIAAQLKTNYDQAHHYASNGQPQAARDAAEWCHIRIELFAPLTEPEFTWP